MRKNILKYVSIMQIIIFLGSMILPNASLAQGVFTLTPPNAMVSLSSDYAPIILRGIKINPENPFKFDFILDPGTSQVRGEDLKE
ncbi:MAG: hypothetical protein P9X22_08560, partial [Candidatus Zapsychrus exili]|nr:hypothetical protein [Candidatus Zapsychrus exili]